MEFTSSPVLIALLNIVIANILLSGDNAVVIAMAARNLSKSHQRKAIFWGSALAILLRIILTIAAVELLNLPYIKMIGAVLLVYIGAQLFSAEQEDQIEGPSNLSGAIRTILFADLIMSLDNVVAVAAVADSAPDHARVMLILVGLSVSIPLIIFGSSVLLKMMKKYPIIITFGATLLGYLAGDMFAQDVAIQETVKTWMSKPNLFFEILGILLVGMIGLKMKKKSVQKD
jgi:YjbE family integral membrane protein